MCVCVGVFSHVCVFKCVFSCVYFHVCVCVSLHMRAQELGKYLGSIVDVVSQLALQEGDVGEVAMELLKYLLMDNTDVIHTTIARLDPLPQHPALAKMTRHCEKIQQTAGQRSFPKVTQLGFCVCACSLYVHGLLSG